jgi:hypothetical protein
MLNITLFTILADDSLKSKIKWPLSGKQRGFDQFQQ